MNQGILMTNVLLGPPAAVEAVGDVPADIVEALLNEVSGPKNQAFLAAMSWKETRHNNKAVRKQSGDDGGQSKGPWQVHSYWAKRTAQHAEDYGQPELADAIRKGISEDIVSNLRGVRALLEVQGQWRDDGGYHSIASYYNEGASWHKAKGQRYADDVMKKYAEYLPLFEALARSNDQQLAGAIIFLLTASIVGINFITDIFLALTDPRVRRSILG